MLPAPVKEAVPATWSLTKGLVVLMPMLPFEARVKRAVLALLRNCNDSEAAPKALVERIRNLCWELLPEKISKEAVPVVLYISNLGEMEAELENPTEAEKFQAPVTVSA